MLTEEDKTEIKSYDTEDLLNDYCYAKAYNSIGELEEYYASVLISRGVKIPDKCFFTNDIYASFKKKLVIVN